MNDRTTEPESIKNIYRNIKTSIICHEFGSGDHLNIEEMAERFRVSTTPVREILNRLVTEKLVDVFPKLGFFMRKLSEDDIRDLYEFNHLLLIWSINRLEREGLGRTDKVPGLRSIIAKLAQPKASSAEYMVERSRELFMHLALQTGNSEVICRISNISDRLHYIRLSEIRYCENRRNSSCELKEVCTKPCNTVDEILKLCRLYENRLYDELRAALDTYHEDRLNLLVPVIKTLRLSEPDLVYGA